MDIARTAHRLDEALCIATPLETVPFPSPAFRAMHSLSPDALAVQVGVYPSGVRLPVFTVQIDLHTPATLRDAWVQFLTPPLVEEMRPPFSVRDAAKVRAGEMLVSPIDVKAFHFAVLVGAPNLTPDVALEAIRTVLHRRFPRLLTLCDLTWDALPSDREVEYRALADEVWASAYDVTDPDLFLERRAFYDEIQQDLVAPLLRERAAASLLEPPHFTQAIAAERTARDLEERTYCRVFGALPPNQVSERLLDALLRDVFHTPVPTNLAALRAEVAELKDDAETFPDLPIAEAARWLERIA